MRLPSPHGATGPSFRRDSTDLGTPRTHTTPPPLTKTGNTQTTENYSHPDLLPSQDEFLLKDRVFDLRNLGTLVLPKKPHTSSRVPETYITSGHHSRHCRDRPGPSGPGVDTTNATEERVQGGPRPLGALGVRRERQDFPRTANRRTQEKVKI